MDATTRQLNQLVKIIHAAFLATVTAAAAHAQQPDQAALKAAEERGLQIYIHDHAASIVSDEVVPLMTSTVRQRVKGYITEAKGGVIVVTFYGRGEGDGLYAWYRAAVGPDGRLFGTVSQYEVPQALSEYEEHAANARETGMNFEFQPCAQNYNFVVLPKPGGWQVYLLPGTTQDDVVPYGGTYRVDTDATGRIMTANRAFSKSCISFRTNADTKALTVSHLLDPQPTEAHVFWQLWSGHSIYLITTQNSLIWPINEGRIKPAEKIDDKN